MQRHIKILYQNGYLQTPEKCAVQHNEYVDITAKIYKLTMQQIGTQVSLENI